VTFESFLQNLLQVIPRDLQLLHTVGVTVWLRDVDADIHRVAQNMLFFIAHLVLNFVVLLGSLMQTPSSSLFRLCGCRRW